MSDRREVSLIVRVVLDANNVVLHGEVIHTGTGRSDRFAGWAGLVRTVRDLLELRTSDAPLPPPAGP